MARLAGLGAVYFGCSTQSLIRAFPGATQLDTPPVVDMDQ